VFGSAGWSCHGALFQCVPLAINASCCAGQHSGAVSAECVAARIFCHPASPCSGAGSDATPDGRTNNCRPDCRTSCCDDCRPYCQGNCRADRSPHCRADCGADCRPHCGVNGCADACADSSTNTGSDICTDARTQQGANADTQSTAHICTHQSAYCCPTPDNVRANRCRSSTNGRREHCDRKTRVGIVSSANVRSSCRAKFWMQASETELAACLRAY